MLILWIILNVLVPLVVIDLSVTSDDQESVFIIIFAVFSAFVIWLRLTLALINTGIAYKQIKFI